MRILVSGATGLIGGALVELLAADGHEVVGLTRRSVPGMVTWDPMRGEIDRDSLGEIEAIVHLAGESIGGRWTERKRRAILESRVRSTELLADVAAEVQPEVLLVGTAIGFYGDRGAEVLTESSPSGTGFLAEVTRQWEASAGAAQAAGVRTVFARTGLVLATEDGSLPPLLRLFKAGVGGKLGSGDQYWSWIGLGDEARALRFLVGNDQLEGPVNLVSPNPVTNRRFTEVLAEALRRPAVLPAPSLALRLALGSDFADELLLASQRILPEKLTEAGFEFDHPDLESALAAIL